MKTKITMLVLFLASTFSFSQNYDIENIRAAFISPHNNKAYFFVGKNKVYQYNPTTKKREWIRTLGTDTFRGLKGSANIDAAFVMPGTTTKAFLFRGNKWYRYSLKDRRLEREGILGQDAFKGILGPIDGAVRQGRSGNIAFFKGKRVFIYSPKTGKVTYSGTIGANNVYKGVPFNIDGVIQWTNGKTYFFKGDYYYRYDPKKLIVDNSKQVTGRVGFKNLFPSIDAVTKIIYTQIKYRGVKGFKDSYYHEAGYKFSSGLDFGQPSLAGVLNSKDHKETPFGYKHYEGVPPMVDAVFEHPINKKTYFLKGTKYYRYNRTSRTVDKVGIIGKDGWKGVPANIDAVFANRSSKTIYFFKGTKVYCYDTSTRKIRTVKPISFLFKGIPNYIDAVSGDGTSVYFYKKTTQYRHTRGSGKISTKSIAKIAK